MGGVVSEHCFVVRHILEAMHLGEYETEWPRYRRLEQATLRGDITSMEMLQLTACRAGVPVPAENYWATFFKPELNAGTVQLISDLRALGNRVVCGTNTIDAHYDYHVAHNQYQCFDAVYASHLMGQAKPDITFWHAIKAAENKFCQYDFSDMFFFDDLPENVEAAASLGLHAHVFTTAEDARAFIESVTGEVIPHAGGAQ